MHGVCRTNNQRLPELVIQDKKKIPAEEEKVHNIVKGVRLV